MWTLPKKKKSPFWIPSSLVYTDDDDDDDFGSQFDPKLFDDMDEPPPVHIMYPRPGFKNDACSASKSRIDERITMLTMICLLGALGAALR